MNRQATATTGRSSYDLAGRESVPVAQRSLSQLLRALPEEDFEALRPHLQSVELVKETVLIEAGAPLAQAYLPESGAISMIVRLSEDQKIELAMIGRDGIVGATVAFGDAISLSEEVVLLPGSASVLDVATFRAVADRSVAFRTPQDRLLKSPVMATRLPPRR